MKTKIFKRITAAMLAATMAVTSVSASAEETITKDSVYEVYGLSESEQEDMLDYAEEVLPAYFKANNYTVDNCNLSYPIFVDNYSSYLMYVIDSTGNFIGKLNIGKVEEQFFSSFSLNVYDKIKDSYNDGELLYFTLKSGNFYILSENNEFYCYEKHVLTTNEIIKNDEVSLISNKDDIFSSDKVQSIKIAKEVKINNNNLSRASTAMLNVNYVNNKKIAEINNYICWAACTAMAVNYMEKDNDDFKELDAEKVYKSVKADMSSIDCNSTYPDGCITCVNHSYECYDYICNSNISTYISASEMYYYISNGKPVQINIKTSTDIAHAIVVKGVMIDSNYVVYTIVDPSKSKTNSVSSVTVRVSGGTATSSFIYTGIDDNGKDITYTTWYRTYRIQRKES